MQTSTLIGTTVLIGCLLTLNPSFSQESIRMPTIDVPGTFDDSKTANKGSDHRPDDEQSDNPTRAHDNGQIVGSPASVGELRRMEDIAKKQRLSLNAAFSEMEEIDAAAIESTKLILTEKNIEKASAAALKTAAQTLLKLITGSPLSRAIIGTIKPKPLDDPDISTPEDMERVIRRFDEIRLKQFNDLNSEEKQGLENFERALDALDLAGAVAYAQGEDVRFRWAKLLTGYSAQPFLVDSTCSRPQTGSVLTCGPDKLNALVYKSSDFRKRRPISGTVNDGHFSLLWFHFVSIRIHF